MSGKLLNLLAISSLAILACSFGPTPVNALTVDSHHFARHLARGHDSVARKKRDNSKRCKVRPSSSSSASAPAPTDSSTPAADSGNSNTGNTNTGNNANTVTSNSGAPPPPNVSGGKGGLAWANGDDPSLANFKSNRVTQLYTWSPDIGSLPAQLGFNGVPMLWGPDQISDFVRLVQPGYANTVMGFNEPNQVGQSDIDPGYGCQLWQQYIAPLKQHGYKTVSPATTSAPDGKTWMQSFFSNGCDSDVVALHWYDVDPNAFIAYVTDFHNTFGKPIWVTEFACQNFNGGAQCTNDQTVAFFTQVTSWMDSQDFVEYYFPFGAMHDMQGVNPTNQLMAPDGGLTDLGHIFVYGS
jgi:hypothetical protein